MCVYIGIYPHGWHVFIAKPVCLTLWFQGLNETETTILLNVCDWVRSGWFVTWMVWQPLLPSKPYEMWCSDCCCVHRGQSKLTSSVILALERKGMFEGPGLTKLMLTNFLHGEPLKWCVRDILDTEWIFSFSLANIQKLSHQQSQNIVPFESCIKIWKNITVSPTLRWHSWFCLSRTFQMRVPH